MTTSRGRRSVNVHGYPIVGAPEVALWTFENSQLDAMALGTI